MTDGRFQRAGFDAQLVARALKDEDFRQRFLADPTGVYAEAIEAALPGHTVPDGVEIRIVEEAADVFYVVLPFLPPGETYSDEVLDRVARHEQTHRHPCWGIGDPPG